MTARCVPGGSHEATAEDPHTRAGAGAALDALRDGVLRVDGDLRVRYLNRAVAELAGVPLEALRGALLPDTLPDVVRTLSLDAAGSLPAATFTAYHAPWDAWLEVRLEPGASERWIVVKRGNGKRHADLELKRRDSVMSAVAYAAERFLRDGSRPDVVRDVLARLGNATRSSRVRVVELPGAGHARPITRESWTAPGDRTEGTPGATPANEPEGTPGRSAPTFTTLPVTVNGRDWGFLEFRDHLQARRWTPSELDALQTAARLLGTALEREHAERQLIHARDEAQRASRAKSEFLSRMSHELRTPLNAILGFTQLLQMDGPRGDAASHLRDIECAGRHLLQLIDELLDIARIEAQRPTVELESVEVHAVVTETLRLTTCLANRHGVKLEPPAGTWGSAAVLADRRALAQVLLNLTSNGIKYNRPGGTVRFDVETKGSRVALTVRDDGWGMTAEQQRGLFEPFARLGAERTDVAGTGIGLALSKGLVERMGGSITVESAAGRGSAFRVTLPAATPQPDAAPERQEERRPPAGPFGFERPHSRRSGPQRLPAGKPVPRRVLCIEDNASNLRLVRSALADLRGLVFLEATCGRQGLALAAEHAPDLVLLDLRLPDMPGDEVLVTLKASERTRDVPVLVLSADAVPQRIGRLRELGAHAFLTKPLDVNALRAAVASTS